MRVRLRRSWFVAGQRYRRGEHEFPPELLKDRELPRDAEKLDEEPEKKPFPKKET